MELISFSVRSSSRREGDGVKEWMGLIVISASYKFHFIRVHDNLVYDPSNYKFIFLIDLMCFKLKTVIINVKGYICLYSKIPFLRRVSQLTLFASSNRAR